MVLLFYIWSMGTIISRICMYIAYLVTDLRGTINYEVGDQFNIIAVYTKILVGYC